MMPVLSLSGPEGNILASGLDVSQILWCDHNQGLKWKLEQKLGRTFIISIFVNPSTWCFFFVWRQDLEPSFMWVPVSRGSRTVSPSSLEKKTPLILKEAGCKKWAPSAQRRRDLKRTSAEATMQDRNRYGLLSSCSWQGCFMLEQVHLLFLPGCLLASPCCWNCVDAKQTGCENTTNSSDGTACRPNCNLQDNNTVEKRCDPLVGSSTRPFHLNTVKIPFISLLGQWMWQIG